MLARERKYHCVEHIRNTCVCLSVCVRVCVCVCVRVCIHVHVYSSPRYSVDTNISESTPFYLSDTVDKNGWQSWD